jgi:hypothetical protein
MHLIKVGDLVVNVDLVAKAERAKGGAVTIHYAVPQPAPGERLPGKPPVAPPPMHSGHLQDVLKGAQADEFWKELQALASASQSST